MTGEWTIIDNVHPEDTAFPARAEVAGEKVVVFRQDDRYWAVQRSCPHQGTDFSRGVIVGNGTMVRCGLHAYTFRLRDGRGINCPGYEIDVYEVVREDDRLMARKVAGGG